MDGIQSGAVCSMVDALFVPVENKLGARPAKSVCCCKWELRKGVLYVGSFTTTVIIAYTPVLFYISPALGALIFATGLAWGYGVWCAHTRDRQGSASTQPSPRARRLVDSLVDCLPTRFPHGPH
jgi:hypothetical protein